MYESFHHSDEVTLMTLTTAGLMNKVSNKTVCWQWGAAHKRF